jgi:hypothetical protein
MTLFSMQRESKKGKTCAEGGRNDIATQESEPICNFLQLISVHCLASNLKVSQKLSTFVFLVIDCWVFIYLDTHDVPSSLSLSLSLSGWFKWRDNQYTHKKPQQTEMLNLQNDNSKITQSFPFNVPVVVQRVSLSDRLYSCKPILL